MADRNQKKPKQQKKTEDKDRIDSVLDTGSGTTQKH